MRKFRKNAFFMAMALAVAVACLPSSVLAYRNTVAIGDSIYIDTLF